MKMFATITGMKRSKGIMKDNGKAYDFTTVFVSFPFVQTDDMRGSATQPLKYGTSDNYQKFADIALPFEAEIEIEAETNGKTVNNYITNIVPLVAKSPAPKTEANKA